MKRFYPDIVPPFFYEPHPDEFEICRIDEKVGEGVVSRAYFVEDQVVCGFTGYLINFITQFSLQVLPDVHLHDPYFMGKILHSCDPNLSCDMERRLFMALRDIQPGDILTMDYTQTEDTLFKPFVCSCGSARCRGLIVGRHENSVAMQEA